MANQRRLDSAKLWEYAVRTLAGRAHSLGELREKLRARAERLEDVEPALARLKDYGYLDDRGFAESFARARLENQRFGKFRVLRELRARRVAPSVAERSVGRVYDGVDEERLIEEALRRKYRNRSSEALFNDDSETAAAYRRLLRAGFTSASIVRVLKRFAKNPELLDQIEVPEEPLQ